MHTFIYNLLKQLFTFDDWTLEKFGGLFTFIGATTLTVDKNIVSADILNTIIKGVINSAFAISVALIIHVMKKQIEKPNKNMKPSKNTKTLIKFFTPAIISGFVIWLSSVGEYAETITTKTANIFSIGSVILALLTYAYFYFNQDKNEKGTN